jgi:hypothetical protein
MKVTTITNHGIFAGCRSLYLMECKKRWKKETMYVRIRE